MRCSLSKSKFGTKFRDLVCQLRVKLRCSLSKGNLQISTMISFVNVGLNQICDAVFAKRRNMELSTEISFVNAQN